MIWFTEHRTIAAGLYWHFESHDGASNAKYKIKYDVSLHLCTAETLQGITFSLQVRSSEQKSLSV